MSPPSNVFCLGRANFISAWNSVFPVKKAPSFAIRHAGNHVVGDACFYLDCRVRHPGHSHGDYLLGHGLINRRLWSAVFALCPWSRPICSVSGEHVFRVVACAAPSKVSRVHARWIIAGVKAVNFAARIFAAVSDHQAQPMGSDKPARAVASGQFPMAKFGGCPCPKPALIRAALFNTEPKSLFKRGLFGRHVRSFSQINLSLGTFACKQMIPTGG